jgi:hypothetical protein
MEPEHLYFDNPQREEWRLPNTVDPETGDPQVVRHRDNEPAVITAKGYKAWYQNGLRHRIGAPAIEFKDLKCWYENGKPHRLDGPAMEFSDGSKQWWENGVRIR